MERLFDLLDQAPTGATSCLTNDDKKVWLETMVFRAHEKLGAARYHVQRIGAMVEELRSQAKSAVSRAPQIDPSLGPGAKSVSRVVASHSDVSYELDALLSAIRAAIDHAGAVMSRHVTGMEKSRQIRGLLKKAAHGQAGAFQPVLDRWSKWIEELKEYRDKCVHYRSLRSNTGHIVETVGGRSAGTEIPFVVPVTVGPEEPDTRYERFYRTPELVGVTESRETVTVCGPEGTPAVASHSVRIEPAPGFETAQDFGARHLRALEGFLEEVFSTCVSNAFRIVP